jgi:hypothetical protein
MYSFLLFLDELHHYLQFLLPFLVYSLLLPSSKFIRYCLTGLWLITQTIVIISVNEAYQIGIQGRVVMYLILPIIIFHILEYILAKLLSKQSGDKSFVIKPRLFIAITSCSILIVFFGTQILTNGCILIHIQNILAARFTSLIYWQNTYLFGSQVFGYNLVLGVYIAILSCLLYYFYWLANLINKLNY